MSNSSSRALKLINLCKGNSLERAGKDEEESPAPILDETLENHYQALFSSSAKKKKKNVSRSKKQSCKRKLSFVQPASSPTETGKQQADVNDNISLNANGSSDSSMPNCKPFQNTSCLDPDLKSKQKNGEPTANSNDVMVMSLAGNESFDILMPDSDSAETISSANKDLLKEKQGEVTQDNLVNNIGVNIDSTQDKVPLTDSPDEIQCSVEYSSDILLPDNTFEGDFSLAEDFVLDPSTGVLTKVTPLENHSLGVPIVSIEDEPWPEANSTDISFPLDGSMDLSGDFALAEEILLDPETGVLTQIMNPLTNQVLANQVLASPIISLPEDAAVTEGVLPLKRKRVDGPRKQVRKRGMHPDTWKGNIAKKALNYGEKHVTPKGKIREARNMGPSCTEKCFRCSKPKLSEESRLKIHTRFWNLGDHTRQWDYIASCVKCFTPSKKFTKEGKQTSRKYHFLIKGKDVRVCKSMFVNTLSVNDCWIETALSKRGKEGTVSPDKRGRHSNRPHRTLEETKQSVKDHINSFPRTESHYCRERTKREYLESGLSREKMYSMYCDWVKDKSIRKPASLRQYKEIFNREFNIAFFKPRKDQCKECNKFKFSTVEEKEKLQEKHNRHIKNKEEAQAIKKADKAIASERDDYCVSTFDLQKVLTCPRSETSVFFYKNKLSVFNFTIFDMGKRQGHCYLWHEMIGGKGSNEIGSNVFSYIQMKVQAGVNEFSFFSDSPSGQNRNRYVASMYYLAAIKFKVVIKHTFLEPGHTYMEVDSMHARIESEATRKEIYDLDEWFNLIGNAKRPNAAGGSAQEGGDQRYILHKLDLTHILDFKPLVNMQNWDVDSKKEKVKWTEIKVMQVDPNKPNTFFLKYEYNGEAITLNLNQRKGRPVNCATYQPPVARDRFIPLRDKKVKDIKWLMETKAIPTQYHQFYEGLLIAGVNNDAEEDEEDE